MKRMKFESFPTEIQLEVFRHLDNTDLKAVRAVSKKLRDNASPFLFRSAILSARYQSLGVFQKLAAHPVLRKYVHEIVFDGSVFGLWLASSSDEYKRKNNEYENLRTGSYYFIRERWKRYKELYDEQADLQASGVMLQTIAKALGSTMNVSRIVYSPSMYLSRERRMDVNGYRMRDNITHKDHPFRQLIGAIYTAQYTGIRELRVAPFDEDDEGVPFTFDLLDCPDPVMDLKAGQYMFQNLEICELNINLRLVPHSMPHNMPGLTLGTRRVVHLGSLIGIAKDLRHLALHVSSLEGQNRLHIGQAQPEQLKFHRLGLNTTWPRLRSLSLQGLNANESDFLDLLMRHKDTLGMMSLRNCSLFTGFWANIVDEALCHGRILPFTLSSVNEVQVPSDPGTLVSSAGLIEWRYNGCIEVSEDGERTFVDSDPTKKSVYSRLL